MMQLSPRPTGVTNQPIKEESSDDEESGKGKKQPVDVSKLRDILKEDYDSMNQEDQKDYRAYDRFSTRVFFC